LPPDVKARLALPVADLTCGRRLPFMGPFAPYCDSSLQCHLGKGTARTKGAAQWNSAARGAASRTSHVGKALL